MGEAIKIGYNTAARFNPRIATLARSLQYIKDNEPCPMNSIPLARHAGYKWMWAFKDRLGLTRIERSTKDGRVHLVWLTKSGEALLSLLEDLLECNQVFCKLCGVELPCFYRIANKRWKRVMGDLENEVVCRKCFDKREKRKSY